MNEYEPSMEDMGSYLSGLGQEQVSSSIPGTPMMMLADEEELGAAAAPQSVDIQQGQWLFRVHAGGRVVIVSGPGAGSSYSPGSAKHAEVLSNLMGQSRAIADQIVQVYPDARDIVRNTASLNTNVPKPQVQATTPAPTSLAVQPMLPYNEQEDVPFYQRPAFQWAVGGVAVVGAAWLAWRLLKPRDEGY